MKIQSKIKDYSVEMIDDLLEKKIVVFKELKYNNLYYFVDTNVNRIYKEKLKQFIDDDFYFLIDANEINKEYNNLANYYIEIFNRTNSVSF